MELVSSFKLELEKEVKIYFHKLFQNKGVYWRILYSISLYYVWQSIPYRKTLPGEALNQMPLIWFEWKLLWTQKNQREKFFASLHSVLIHCGGPCSLYMPPPPQSALKYKHDLTGGISGLSSEDSEKICFG